jgi:hypothetical protein
MNDIPVIGNLLSLNAQTALSSRPPTDNIANDIELALALGRKGEPLARIIQQSLPGLRRRVRVPVIRLLRTSNDSSTVEGPRDTEGPRAIGILTGDGLRDVVTNETSLS